MYVRGRDINGIYGAADYRYLQISPSTPVLNNQQFSVNGDVILNWGQGIAVDFFQVLGNDTSQPGALYPFGAVPGNQTTHTFTPNAGRWSYYVIAFAKPCTSTDYRILSGTVAMPINSFFSNDCIVEAYDVTNSVPYATLSRYIAAQGVAYNGTLTPIAGYSLPTSINVTSNGANITNSITYNSSNGSIHIPASQVTGPITISVAVTIPITNNVTNTTLSPLSATQGTVYDGVLTPATGFLLPESITMTRNGATFTNFTYTQSTGAITIAANQVTGNFTFIGAAIPQPIGVEVTGSIEAYNPAYPATVTLKQGGEVKYQKVVDAAGGTGKVTQEFEFNGVIPGTYELIMQKPGHLIYTKLSLVVGSVNIALNAVAMIPGDFDGNGYVSINDYNILLEYYNKSGSDIGNHLVDIDGNGHVNLNDFQIFLEGYGKSAIIDP